MSKVRDTNLLVSSTPCFLNERVYPPILFYARELVLTRTSSISIEEMSITSVYKHKRIYEIFKQGNKCILGASSQTQMFYCYWNGLKFISDFSNKRIIRHGSTCISETVFRSISTHTCRPNGWYTELKYINKTKKQEMIIHVLIVMY
jgi:hypothetical protein